MSDAGQPNVTQPLPKIGSYRLIQQLGSGGMSSVFRAIHTETGHEVAVKVLPRYLAKNPTLLQRFLREAKSAESLEHPNIVAIFDRGSDEGRYYLVLEFVPGGDLHDRVRDKGPIGAAQVVEILRDVANGLRFAAGRGLIHRDIKPANLLVSPEGVVKITDLGLALQVAEEDERVTRDGTTVGTVDYMAPEQARDSRATSVRSDIYSLGCTCYYLLTGSPPFPGGDVAEKLRRHAQEPSPDVCKIRPEVPQSLARLVQKMMAKRPDDRFGDYDHLIRALDSLKLDGPAGAEAPLTALIDDDEEDEAQLDSSGFRLASPIPMAEIDDEEDDRPSPKSTIVPPVAAKGRPPSAARRTGPPPPRAPDSGDMSLADLAALDDDEAPAPARRKRGAAPITSPPTADLLDPEGPQAAVAGPARVGGAGDPSLQTYIVRGLMFGLVAVLVGFGIFQLANLASSNPSGEQAKSEEEAPPASSEGGPSAPEPPIALPKPGFLPKPAVAQKKDQGQGSIGGEASPATAWVEPAEAPPAEAPEKAYEQGPDWQKQFVPDWGLIATPEEFEGPFVTVRRVGGQKGDAPDLARAFNQNGGTVEVADDGPFFERDLRITGEARAVRARQGFRPIWVVEAPSSEYYKERPGVFELEDKKVVLRGIDLILRSDDFPNQAAVFVCRGAELALVDCTVTVVGNRPMALVQVGEPGGEGGAIARVRLERTFVRGSGLTLLRLTNHPAEVVVDRSVALCGGGPAVTVAGRANGPRKLWWKRSIVASAGPILDLASATGVPLGFRVLGTTLARIQSHSPASLIELRDEAAGASPREAVDWLGFDNVAAGFDGWLAAPGRGLKVPDLAAARRHWPSTGDQTRVDPNPWPESNGLDEAAPAGLARLAPEGVPTLARVASPSPYLWQKTFGSFARQKIPVATATTPGAPAPGPRGASGPERPLNPAELPGMPRPSGRVGPMPGPAAPARNAPQVSPTGELDLTFDVQAEPWKGDLGAFLREQIQEGTIRVRVRAKGGGAFVSSPIRPPDGVSLEVVVEPGAKEPLVWFPQPDAVGEAFFEVRGGDLSVTNGWLRRFERRGLKHMVRVEDGRLTLTDCRVTTSMAPEGDDLGLIALVSDGTRPLPERPGGSDRPVARIEHCVLLAGGTAVEADLGHGVVALDDVALASGADAIVLRPQRVRRDRLQADLWLDRCTMVAARSFVRLGPWPGQAPGPDRPWVVFSYKSAFLDAFDRGRAPAQAAVLRADPEALAHDALFWQPGGDAYDVTHFAVAGGATPSPPATGPDVERQWVALWGRSHVKLSLIGPERKKPNVPIQLVARKLKPGAPLEPGDLALDPNYPKGRKSLDVGADSRRLRIAPAATPGRIQPGRSNQPSGSR